VFFLKPKRTRRVFLDIELAEVMAERNEMILLGEGVKDSWGVATFAIDVSGVAVVLLQTLEDEDGSVKSDGNQPSERSKIDTVDGGSEAESSDFSEFTDESSRGQESSDKSTITRLTLRIFFLCFSFMVVGGIVSDVDREASTAAAACVAAIDFAVGAVATLVAERRNGSD